MSFSERLKKAMSERQMNQAELSALTGIGKSSISQYLSGKNEPKDSAIQKMADALDCSVDYLKGLIEDGKADIIERNIPIMKAAKLMNKSPQFIRVGLQRGILPFGHAVKMSSKWSYYISPKKFYEYTGFDNNDNKDNTING